MSRRVSGNRNLLYRSGMFSSGRIRKRGVVSLQVGRFEQFRWASYWQVLDWVKAFVCFSVDYKCKVSIFHWILHFLREKHKEVYTWLHVGRILDDASFSTHRIGIKVLRSNKNYGEIFFAREFMPRNSHAQNLLLHHTRLMRQHNKFVSKRVCVRKWSISCSFSSGCFLLYFSIHDDLREL